MKATGIYSPWVFRTYILLFSIAGLYYLLKLSYSITENFYYALFVVLFGATSPVFVYYQAGFLPTIPALSTALIGLYFYQVHRNDRSTWYFMWSIFFLTLATLGRLPFAIPLISVVLIELLILLRNILLRKWTEYNQSKLYITGLGFALLFLNFIHTDHLRDRYGSDFLSQPMPPSTIQEIIDLVRVTNLNWATQYFSTYHYGLIIALLLAVIFYRMRSRKPFIPDDWKINFWGLLTILMFTGSLLYALLMLRQFPAHDYYFLDTFFLPGLLFVIVLLSLLPEASKPTGIHPMVMILLFGCSLFMVMRAIQSQKERRKSELWDRSSKMIANFKGADDFLDSLGIGSEARILVLDANIPNAPFLLMERKGYPVMNTTRKNIENALKWNYDYIVIQNDYFISDIYSVYPEIVNRIEKIADNRKISLFKLRPHPIETQSVLDFWKLDKASMPFSATMDYDTIVNDSYWSNVKITRDTVLSGEQGGVLVSDREYGLTFSVSDIQVWTINRPVLFISSYFLSTEIADLYLVIDLTANDERMYFRTVNLEPYIQAEGEWEKAEFIFQLPQLKDKMSNLKVYLWNQGHNHIYLDDFSVLIYP